MTTCAIEWQRSKAKWSIFTMRCRWTLRSAPYKSYALPSHSAVLQPSSWNPMKISWPICFSMLFQSSPSSSSRIFLWNFFNAAYFLKGHKKRKRAESAGSAAGLAFRSPRATRRKRSTKKRRRSGWSVSRKARNKKAHADNGNGLSANKLGLVIAAFFGPGCAKGPDRNRGNCGDQFRSVPSGDRRRWRGSSILRWNWFWDRKGRACHFGMLAGISKNGKCLGLYDQWQLYGAPAAELRWYLFDLASERNEERS